MGTHMKLTMPFFGIDSRFDQALLPGLDTRTNSFRRMRMADGHDVVAVATCPTQTFDRRSGYRNRRMRPLHRARIKRQLVIIPEFSVVAAPFVRPCL